ncbi:MAG: hypothetical protein QM493_00275 [Sulfurovum sp.]
MIDMNNIDGSLNDIMTLNGALAASLIDWESGMALGMVSNGNFDIELASAGNAEVLKAKMAVMRSLGLSGGIKDILITLTDQIHILTLIEGQGELCIYAALDSSKANLALARNKLQSIAKA